VRALAMRPDLLLLDEVTSALDPELVAEVLSLVRELALGGMTMLIATHEMGFARDIANRVCFLDAGRILEEGPPEQIFRAPREERTQRFSPARDGGGPAVAPRGARPASGARERHRIHRRGLREREVRGERQSLGRRRDQVAPAPLRHENRPGRRRAGLPRSSRRRRDRSPGRWRR